MYDECKEGVSMVRRGAGGGGVEWCLMVLSRGGHFSSKKLNT